MDHPFCNYCRYKAYRPIYGIHANAPICTYEEQEFGGEPLNLLNTDSCPMGDLDFHNMLFGEGRWKK